MKTKESYNCVAIDEHNRMFMQKLLLFIIEFHIMQKKKKLINK